jgi:hypothetical protein
LTTKVIRDEGIKDNAIEKINAAITPSAEASNSANFLVKGKGFTLTCTFILGLLVSFLIIA